MSGFQVGAVCYPDSLAAVRAMAALEVGGLRQIGTSLFVVDSSAQSGNSITYNFRDVASSSAFSVTQSVNPLPCGLLDWQDGLVLGWAVAAVWLTTSFVLYLRKAVHE